AASLELFSFFCLFLKVPTLDVSGVCFSGVCLLLIVVAGVFDTVFDTVSALVLTMLKLELNIIPKIVAPIKTDAVFPETFLIAYLPFSLKFIRFFFIKSSSQNKLK